MATLLRVSKSVGGFGHAVGKANFKTMAPLASDHGHSSHGHAVDHPKEESPHGWFGEVKNTDPYPNRAVTYFDPHTQHEVFHPHKLPEDHPWFKEDIHDPNHIHPYKPAGIHQPADYELLNWEARPLNLPPEYRIWRHPLFAAKKFLGVHEDKTPVQRVGAEYLKRQKELRRPISPHLTIYKPQLTSMLSITHRATGMAIGFGSLGVCGLLAFSSHDFSYFIEALRALELSQPTWAFVKYLIAVPITYHYFNGVRFLAFEYAKGLDNIKQVYQSGWTVVGLAIAVATLLSIWKGQH